MHDITVFANRDAYVSSRERHTRFGGRIALKVGRGHGGVVYRSFLLFDLGNLPHDREVSRAELFLQIRRNPPSRHPKMLAVRPVLESWREAAIDWSNQPRFGAVASKRVMHGRRGEVISFEIGDLVRAWRTGTLRNRGIAVTALDERRFGFVKFGSRERLHVVRRPRLVIWTRADPRPPEPPGCRPRYRSHVRRDVEVGDVPEEILRKDVRHEQLVTYAFHNHGPSAALVDLQLSPDGAVWLDDPPQKRVEPGQSSTLVPRYFLRYTRLMAQAEDPGGSARLTAWFQAQSG